MQQSTAHALARRVRDVLHAAGIKTYDECTVTPRGDRVVPAKAAVLVGFGPDEIGRYRERVVYLAPGYDWANTFNRDPGGDIYLVLQASDLAWSAPVDESGFRMVTAAPPGSGGRL